MFRTYKGEIGIIINSKFEKDQFGSPIEMFTCRILCKYDIGSRKYKRIKPYTKVLSEHNVKTGESEYLNLSIQTWSALPLSARHHLINKYDKLPAAEQNRRDMAWRAEQKHNMEVYRGNLRA